MASLRAWFLAVYASNGIIKALFLPTCYIILFSPFTLAIAYYFGLDHTVQSLLPKDFSLLDLLPHLALSAVLLFLPTRLLTGSKHDGTNGTKGKDERRARRVQSLPYWIPGAKHFWSIIFAGESWIKDIRQSSLADIISYNVAGANHNIIFLDSLLEQVYKTWANLQELRPFKLAILRNAFSSPTSAESQYLELSPSIAKLVQTDMFEGDQMHTLINSSLNILSESLPDLITFNSSIVDQMQWERVSNVELTDGISEAECDLFTLINEYCCNAILPPIMGTQFTESYQLLATDLATFNQRFWALALGLPRLFPVQGLPGAALAQKRLISNMKKFLNELTNPPMKRVPDDDESVSGDEMDLDTLTPFTKLNVFFTEHNLPMELRASIVLQLVHRIMAEVVPLVFWTLLHVCSSSASLDNQDSPLKKIKAETQAWAMAVQPPSIHPSFPAPPEIRFKSAAEATPLEKFPYLRSCINETRRLYYSGNSVYEVTKPTILEAKSVTSVDKEQWSLDVGSYIDIGFSRNLINMSPANHISPLTYQPDRFMTTPAPASVTSIHEPSTPYTNALLISLIAGLLQLWELSPAPKKTFYDHIQEVRAEASMSDTPLSQQERTAKDKADKEKREKQKEKSKWILPKAIDGGEIKVPKTDIRVRIRRIEGLPTTNVPGRIG